jgi:predicted RNA binding protein YcfA (HicA-like mRNA interferase family)
VKTPRDVSGAELIQALRVMGYQRARQEGSHVRLTTRLDGEHHLTIPNHTPLRVGTFRSILKLVAAHHGLSVEALLNRLGL